MIIYSKFLMFWGFLGVKMVMQLFLQNKRENPAFLLLCPQERALNSFITATISTQNRHFGQSIMAQTTLKQSINIGDNNSNCNNTIGSYNNIYKSDEDEQIMRWLSPLEPNNRHHDVRTGRFEGVGNWLLETREWREWRAGEGGADGGVLFCSGNPGVGKTYLRYHKPRGFWKEGNSANG